MRSTKESYAIDTEEIHKMNTFTEKVVVQYKARNHSILTNFRRRMKHSKVEKNNKTLATR